jgi:hypothetical protein
VPPWATRKIAGIPAWGWAVAALGAVALGIYFRRKAVATNNASNAGGSSLDDLANSLAGGTPQGAPSGLDPALADLLNSAMGLVGQGISDGAMGAGGGYYDPGTGFDGSGDGGQDTPASTNVASSGAGTLYDQIINDPALSAPHPAATYNPDTGMVTDPWSGVSWSPGFATLTAADVARATGSGAAPLASRSFQASRPIRPPATRSSTPARPAPRPSSGGFTLVRPSAPRPPARPPARPSAPRRTPPRRPPARSSSGWARV